jgi:hypothetical protein
MSEQEMQGLLSGNQFAVNARDRVKRKGALYSVGFIFGYKLRWALGILKESEMEVYIWHLRSLSTRDYSDGKLVEVVACGCETYILEELRKAMHQLAELRQRNHAR